VNVWILIVRLCKLLLIIYCFILFIRWRLLSLLIIVSCFYRWAEISHITNSDSYYER
jgi:hypothetical protein